MMSAMKSVEDGHRPAYETAASKITALISSTGLKPDAAAQAMQTHLEGALTHSKQEVRRRLGVEAVE